MLFTLSWSLVSNSFTCIYHKYIRRQLNLFTIKLLYNFLHKNYPLYGLLKATFTFHGTLKNPALGCSWRTHKRSCCRKQGFKETQSSFCMFMSHAFYNSLKLKHFQVQSDSLLLHQMQTRKIRDIKRYFKSYRISAVTYHRTILEN